MKYNKRLKICFLVSGNGGNLKFFDLAVKKHILQNIELSVIADRKCGAVEYGQKAALKSFLINYTKQNNGDLLSVLEGLEPDIIITNWHKIIDEEVVKKYERKMINLHYSLLPSFAGTIGIEAISQAISNKCQYIGATCHYVSDILDGGEIISQAVVKSTDNKQEKLIDDVFRSGCLILLNSILLISNFAFIKLCENNKFQYSPSLQFDDTLFGDDFWLKLKNA